MTTVQLKTKIQERIDRTHDTLLLEAIYDMLGAVDGEVVKFTPEQYRRVMRGLEQMKNGEVVSEEEADREIEEWLREG
jgi:predicted transcriptional regulator